MTPPGLTGSPLDRMDAIRHDEAAIAALMADPRALQLALNRGEPLVDGDGRLAWDPLDRAQPLALLGLIEGVPHFAAIPSPAEPSRRTPRLMAAIGQMRNAEASTYAAARSLADWHARHHYCANCGYGTEAIRAGWARRCTGCEAEHFPRTDPVVIMLAEHRQGADRRVLVGRQPGFPPGRYSALAGFVEVGESIEEAVTRELHEEAGVRASQVRYVASQPWPFASSLMIAAVAEVPDDTLTIDRTELEDARWVGEAEVRAALAGDPAAPFAGPPPYAIAHTLFERWLVEAGQG